MPSQSISQQRLMGVAYAVKSGDMQLSDVDSEYRDKVKELVDGMSLKDLKDFASTPHEGLPEVVENVTPDSIGGMGQVQLPTETAVGSGDIPAGRGDAKKRYKKKMKFKHKIATYEEFLSKEDSQINEAKFKAGQVWMWKHVDGDKEVEVVDVKSNGDVVGRVKGTSQDFIVRDANKWLKKKVSESVVTEAQLWDKLNKIAKKEYGESGFATLSEEEMSNHINMNMADKLADKMFGEFGFAALSEDEMAQLINKNPKVITESVEEAKMPEPRKDEYYFLVRNSDSKDVWKMADYEFGNDIDRGRIEVLFQKNKYVIKDFELAKRFYQYLRDRGVKFFDQNFVSESVEVNEARSLNKIQKDFTAVTSEMSEVVLNWKAAKASGDAKAEANFLARLKDLTAKKKGLEREMDEFVMGKDRDAELVGALESVNISVFESMMAEIDIIAQEAKDFKDFSKKVMKEFKLEDDKDLFAWLKSLYDNRS